MKVMSTEPIPRITPGAMAQAYALSCEELRRGLDLIQSARRRLDLAFGDGGQGVPTTTTKLPPVHPADVLVEDFMKPLGWGARELASESSLPEWLCEELARKVARFTEGVSDRLGDTFGISRDLFRNLQLQYDRETGTPPPPAANQADSIQTLLSASEGIANEIREAARKIIQKYGWDKEEKE